jgi:hypothetical protein
MGEAFKGSVDYVEFVGMASNVDPHDIPAGAAQIQVNMNIVTQGLLRLRGGLREVAFEEEDS